MRLIDVDALFEQMKKLYQKRSEESNMTGDRAACVTWNDAVFCIKDSPVIDAVPVVRCKDCKYLNKDLAVGEWDGSCRYWNTHSVLYSWFCSQGERKDGDGNGV